MEGKMIRFLLVGLVLSAFVFGTGIHAEASKSDIIPTSEGDLKITLIGHGTLITPEAKKKTKWPASWS
jgi:hypothetical protein